nr:hypothetical protein [Chloroflexota bacterium]
MDMNTMTGRLMRVLRFDASVYREIAADGTAMMQAGIVVTLAALIAALGRFADVGILGVVVVAIVAIVGFFVYSGIATIVSKVLGGKTGFNEMGRTLGYAYAWYALGILVLVPGVGGFLAWLGSIVAAVAGFIALRESSEFGSLKALITVIVAAVAAVIVTAILTSPLLLMLGVAGG